MHIGLVLWSLYTLRGGLQRQGALIANEMSHRGHKVYVFCQKIPVNSKPLFCLNDSVSSIELSLETSSSIEMAKKKVTECKLDVMCAMFSWDALLWMPFLMQGTGIPLVISERNHPQIIENERWNAYERRACLASADKIHVLLNEYLKMLPTFLQERASVIPNIALPPIPIPLNREDILRKRIIAVGRMNDDHKQFSLLLHAFKIIASRNDDWDLCICGDGRDRQIYENLIKQFNLEKRVLLPGMVDNVDDYYSKSHVFCIPSRYEGIPNTLLEAQRHGLPSVGFAGCTGTNEVIIHGENGLLVQNQSPVDLAASLQVLINNEKMRLYMGFRSQELLERYDKQRLMDYWEKLFAETARNRGNTRLDRLTWSEQVETECALQEILSRKHPFVRPMCGQLEIEQTRLQQEFQKVINLLYVQKKLKQAK